MTLVAAWPAILRWRVSAIDTEFSRGRRGRALFLFVVSGPRDAVTAWRDGEYSHSCAHAQAPRYEDERIYRRMVLRHHAFLE
jgi:hypothetical protein